MDLTILNINDLLWPSNKTSKDTILWITSFEENGWPSTTFTCKKCDFLEEESCKVL